jgi:hypothetical protein
MTQLRDGTAGSQPENEAVRSASETGTLVGGAAPGSSLREVPPGVSGVHRIRVARVARALTTVGALDDEVAEQILADFELAAFRNKPSARFTDAARSRAGTRAADRCARGRGTEAAPPARPRRRQLRYRR